MGATIDHISNGRWGLNVVSGWSEHEFGMMGIEIMPHAERYQRTEAYIEILKGLWTSEPGTFNHESKWYRIRDGWVSPLPVQRPHPPIANAGVSEDARRVLARLCDMAFISLFSFEATAEVTSDIRTRAAQFGRTVKCCTYPFVVWRETEREAEEERRREARAGRWRTADLWHRRAGGRKARAAVSRRDRRRAFDLPGFLPGHHTLRTRDQALARATRSAADRHRLIRRQIERAYFG
jgi:alkanesulfonate monooxygenase SsuD/methylene tetrahydromethanopterin reductase-like flavin-dependent oxidoreductase (luciferase family)